MGSDVAKSNAVGFFTVVRSEQHGLFGGYLLLNRSGRPLEFHCTAPVKPNRAQEILYGPTLESYLFGEAIGATLLARGSTPVDFVCVELPAALALREFSPSPIALVVAPEADAAVAGAESLPLFRVDAAHERGLHRFRLGAHDVAVPRRYAADEPMLTTYYREVAETFDLQEPFVRIRGAIEEAQRGGR